MLNLVIQFKYFVCSWHQFCSTSLKNKCISAVTFGRVQNPLHIHLDGSEIGFMALLFSVVRKILLWFLLWLNYFTWLHQKIKLILSSDTSQHFFLTFSFWWRPLRDEMGSQTASICIYMMVICGEVF